MACGTAVSTGRDRSARQSPSPLPAAKDGGSLPDLNQPQALLGAGLRTLRIFAAGIRRAMIGIMVRRFVVRDRLLSAHREIGGDLCVVHALDLRGSEARSLCRVHVADV